MRWIMIMLALVWLEGVAYAGYEKKAVTAPKASSVSAKDVGNKMCPVSGEEVGKMGPVEKMEYKGKVYNFCCKMCIKDFKKNPEKFIKKLETEKKK